MEALTHPRFMRRVKVISEPTDLVPLLRALDTEVKREVFKEIATQWCPVSYISRKYGEEGEESLRLFEKTKLVETRFENIGGQPEKVYHSYYSNFNINCSTAVQDVGEILAVASLPESEFREMENVILSIVGEEGASARAVTEKLNIPLIRLRSLLKRSTRLDLRGHVVLRTDDARAAAAPPR
jgi:predicted DNA-binding ArsR family transcriptional regulator